MKGGAEVPLQYAPEGNVLKAPVAHDGYGKVAMGLLRWAMIPALVLVLCVVPNALMYWSHRDQKLHRARLEMRNLHQALITYRERTGHWPAEQRWAEQLIELHLLGRAPDDPWDRPYRYRIEALPIGNSQPVLTSPGRDGVLDTEDDISSNEPAQGATQ